MVVAWMWGPVATVGKSVPSHRTFVEVLARMLQATWRLKNWLLLQAGRVTISIVGSGSRGCCQRVCQLTLGKSARSGHNACNNYWHNYISPEGSQTFGIFGKLMEGIFGQLKLRTRRDFGHIEVDLQRQIRDHGHRCYMWCPWTWLSVIQAVGHQLMTGSEEWQMRFCYQSVAEKQSPCWHVEVR